MLPERLKYPLGRAYLGGLPSRDWSLHGAVDNVAIWNAARTANQPGYAPLSVLDRRETRFSG